MCIFLLIYTNFVRLRLEHIYVSIRHVCCVFSSSSSSFELHNHCCEINFIKTLLSIRILFCFIGNVWYGVDINKETVADNLEACVWEPPIIKINALQAACEAACMILSVDETIKSPESSGGQPGPQMPSMGRGMGRPMM